jgi:glyoxylase-like metal-dependent hydrolase (beta-lactamase superfamily II)
MLDVPIVAFLVEHPTVGPFLIDTGLHSSIAEQGAAGNFGRLGALGYKGLQMEPEQAVRGQLNDRGVSPDEIGLIVMTHLHADHASAIAEFPGAAVTVAKREWDNVGGSFDGYSVGQLDASVDYRLIDLDAEGIRHDSFERTVDLFGDGSVRVVDTPGHSPGHLSLILRLRGGEALLTGDAVFTVSALRGEAEPWRIQDRSRYRNSLSQLQGYVAGHPATLVIPGHDMEAWEALRQVY